MELSHIHLEEEEGSPSAITPEDSARRLLRQAGSGDSPLRMPLPAPIRAAMALGFGIFLVVALSLDAKRASGLLVMTLFAVGVALNRRYPGPGLTLLGCCGSAAAVAARRPWLTATACGVPLLAFIVIEAVDEPERIVSLLGLLTFIGGGYAFSHDRSAVQWRPVLMGLGLQMLFGLVILRSAPGKDAFEFLGDQVGYFLDYSDAGAALVFGDNFRETYFAFKVLPTVIFFSSIVSVAFYLGALQFLVANLATALQRALGTSASESLNAAGNIFIGQTEAPLLVRPFLKEMTLSELHAVMTGGFATLAGGVLAAYASFGIDVTHLIAASVMSAPAALAVSKLVRPETEQSATGPGKEVRMDPSKETNVVEAAAAGATTGVLLAGNIAGNLIAFVSCLAFVNGVLGWVGGMVDYPELSFETICSYALVPVAWLMGVPAADCRSVGQLLGTKMFVNEFVAYVDLAAMVDAGSIGHRAETIAIYALCGFANFGSIGIQLGGLGALAPERRADLSKIAVSAMLSGTVACFMTACVAGCLVKGA